MLKKLTLLAMSVGALLAFAAPAAQATTGPLITNGLGSASTRITATSTNTIVHTSAGTLECKTWDLKLHAVTNKDTTFHSINGTGYAVGTLPATHTGHCGTSSGAISEITNIHIATFHLTKHGGETTGTATFQFTYDLRTPPTPGNLIAECTFAGTIPVKVTGTEGGGGINVNGEIAKTGGGAFCPATGTITGTFALTDEESGLPVVFD